MNFRFSGPRGLSLIIISAGLCLVFLLGACSGNKYSCEANHSRNYHKIKKNKSNYNLLYSPKSRPVPKDYMLKNGR